KDNPLRVAALELRQHSGAQKRGFSRSGGADDDLKPIAALIASRVEPLDDGADFLVTAEEDRGVLGFEGVNAGIGRPIRIKLEAAGKLARNRAQFLFKKLETAAIQPDHIGGLYLWHHGRFVDRGANDRQDFLAERSGLRIFDEAPLRLDPVR